ncbi:hypothetical protein NKG05_25750 [Oerskovia sp. M15]
MTDSESPSPGGPVAPVHRHLELVAAVLLSIATVMTAWSAFQSARWGGEMATSYSAAGAARTESNRASTLAGQQTIIDVQLFTDWLSALDEEQGPGAAPGYVPDPETYSGFLYARFREEFKPAVEAWVAQDPRRTRGSSEPVRDGRVRARLDPGVAAAREEGRRAGRAGARGERHQGQLRAGHGHVRLGALLRRDRRQALVAQAAPRDGGPRRRRPAGHARRPDLLPGPGVTP